LHFRERTLKAMLARGIARGRSALLVNVTSPMMPVDSVVTSVAVSHRQLARLAQFLVPRDHAFGDFRYVWNGVGTKPHRIGRAGLTRLGGAFLSHGGAQPDNEQTDRERLSADETHDPQHMLSSLSSRAVTIQPRTLEHDREKRRQFSQKFRRYRAASIAAA
jgi:hypothetical protein